MPLSGGLLVVESRASKIQQETRDLEQQKLQAIVYPPDVHMTRRYREEMVPVIVPSGYCPEKMEEHSKQHFEFS